MEQARPISAESVETFRSLGEVGQRGLAGALLNLGAVMEDVKKTHSMYQESLALSRDLGDIFLIAEGLQDTGGMLMEQGKFKEAQEAVEEDLALREKIKDVDGMGTAYMELGNIAFFQGKSAEAEMNFAESLECFRKVEISPL